MWFQKQYSNLDRDENTTIFSLFKKPKNTIPDFSQGTTRVL